MTDPDAIPYAELLRAPRDTLAEAWLEAHAWDDRARRWLPRSAGAVVETPRPSSSRTPAELFASAYRDEEAQAFRALLEEGHTVEETADRRWRARAGEGWTPGEIGAVLFDLVAPHTLRELAARHEGLQRWGGRPVAVPGARRNIMGAIWTGETWAPSTEGELWPTPHTWEWLRLRRASPGQITKVFVRDEAGAWAVDRQAPPVWYVPEVIAVADDVEAWAELLQEWEHDAESLLVRGVLVRNPDARGRMRRTLRGDEAWIAPHPVGRRVLVFDFDKLDPAELKLAAWPGDQRWPTVDEAAELVRAAIRVRLPKAFHGAACAYRWSSSAGVPGGSRGAIGWSRPYCHVVFVVDRPAHDESLALWLAGRADPSVAGSEHALYLSPPVFEGAPAPPWPEGFDRVGVLDGAAEVVTPAELVDGDEWALLCELAALEEHVDVRRAALEAERSRPPATRAPGRTMTPLERAKAWLACREPAIEGQGGDRHTYVTCAAMVHDFGLSEAEALEALGAWNATCRPPWSEAGLRQKVAAALAYGTGAKGSKIGGKNHAR